MAGGLGFNRKFRKGFYKGPARADGPEPYSQGYNIPIRQDGAEQPHRAVPSDENPKRFGFYRVYDAEKNPRFRHYPRALLLDYGLGGNGLSPPALLRDYLVQVHAGSSELLLGKAYLALGPLSFAAGFFVLERVRSTTSRLGCVTLKGETVDAQTAAEQERALASDAEVSPRMGLVPRCEPLAMLVRRGFSPSLAALDLPFDPQREDVERVVDELDRYAVRLFLRGAIARPEGLLPMEGTRYLSPRSRASDRATLGIPGFARSGWRWTLSTRPRRSLVRRDARVVRRA